MDGKESLIVPTCFVCTNSDSMMIFQISCGLFLGSLLIPLKRYLIPSRSQKKGDLRILSSARTTAILFL